MSRTLKDFLPHEATLSEDRKTLTIDPHCSSNSEWRCSPTYIGQGIAALMRTANGEDPAHVFNTLQESAMSKSFLDESDLSETVPSNPMHRYCRGQGNNTELDLTRFDGYQVTDSRPVTSIRFSYGMTYKDFREMCVAIVVSTVRNYGKNAIGNAIEHDSDSLASCDHGKGAAE